MRTVPSSVDYGGAVSLQNLSDARTNITSASVEANSGRDSVTLNFSVSSGLTANNPYSLQANNDASAYVGLSAEL